MLLPALTLAIFPAAVIGRITAGTLDELRNDEFARTIRAMGIPRFRATARHILPNALLPILTNGAILIGYIVTGAVFGGAGVRTRPGIGTMMVDAVTNKDYPVVEAGALVFAGVFVILDWVVDMTYVLVDPRVQFPGGRRRWRPRLSNRGRVDPFQAAQRKAMCPASGQTSQPTCPARRPSRRRSAVLSALKTKGEAELAMFRKLPQCPR